MSLHIIPYATGGNHGLGNSLQAMVSHAQRDIRAGERYRLVFALPVNFSHEKIQVGDEVRVNHVSFRIDGISGDIHHTVVDVTIITASPWLYVVYGVGALLGVGTALYLGGEAAEKVGEAAEKSEGAIAGLGMLVILGLIAWSMLRRRGA